MPCKYSNLFGKPGEGGHKYRLFNIAIVDVILTIVGAIAISYAFNLPAFYTILAMFVLGVIMHRAFCVRTTVDKFIFPSSRL